jgi:hypothetical protein
MPHLLTNTSRTCKHMLGPSGKSLETCSLVYDSFLSCNWRWHWKWRNFMTHLKNISAFHLPCSRHRTLADASNRIQLLDSGVIAVITENFLCKSWPPLKRWEGHLYVCGWKMRHRKGCLPPHGEGEGHVVIHHVHRPGVRRREVFMPVKGGLTTLKHTWAYTAWRE